MVKFYKINLYRIVYRIAVLCCHFYCLYLHRQIAEIRFSGLQACRKHVQNRTTVPIYLHNPVFF